MVWGRGRKGRGQHVRRPPPVQMNPTSAARPVLANLKTVSAETEGTVSRHDAAVAAPELMAGRQKLCRVKKKERKSENRRKGV